MACVVGDQLEQTEDQPIKEGLNIKTPATLDGLSPKSLALTFGQGEQEHLP